MVNEEQNVDNMQLRCKFEKCHGVLISIRLVPLTEIFEINLYDILLLKLKPVH